MANSLVETGPMAGRYAFDSDSEALVLAGAAPSSGRGGNRRVGRCAEVPGRGTVRFRPDPRRLPCSTVGFLLKDATTEELIAAVRVLVTGDAVLAPAVTRRVIEAFGSLPPPDEALAARLSSLSARETEVLRLLARGLSNAEIAR